MEKKILKAEELARTGDSVEAARLDDELLTEHAGELQVWLLRGYCMSDSEADWEAASRIFRPRGSLNVNID